MPRSWLVQPQPWEYRWRALPLFLSQGVAVVANAWVTRSLAMPAHFPATAVAVVLGFAGVFLRVWGVGLISAATMASMTLSTERLVKTGIYGLVRNPLYLGDLLLFVGYGVLLAPVVGLAFIAFHIVRTLRLITFEEARLAAHHGPAFDEYAREVPRLWPRLATPPTADVNWSEALASSSIWAGFAAGYVAVLMVGDVWALAPSETVGFLFAAQYFSRARRSARAGP